MRVTHVRIANPWWRGKRSSHSQHLRNSQFYVSGKRPMGIPITWIMIIKIKSLMTVLSSWSKSLYLKIQSLYWNGLMGPCSFSWWTALDFHTFAIMAMLVLNNLIIPSNFSDFDAVWNWKIMDKYHDLFLYLQILQTINSLVLTLHQAIA